VVLKFFDIFRSYVGAVLYFVVFFCILPLAFFHCFLKKKEETVISKHVYCFFFSVFHECAAIFTFHSLFDPLSVCCHSWGPKAHACKVPSPKEKENPYFTPAAPQANTNIDSDEESSSDSGSSGDSSDDISY
jgi:hypothetical protein